MHKHAARWPIALSVRVYRLLLAAYPQRFRREYGREMALAFRDCCRDGYRRGGSFALVRLWLHVLPDLAVSALGERFDGLARPASRMSRGSRGMRRASLRWPLRFRAPAWRATRLRKRLVSLVAALAHALRRQHMKPAHVVLPRGQMYMPPRRRATTSDRFERYSKRALRMLTLAQEEARTLHHGYLRTEHLLLGLLREGDGVAAEALKRLDVDLDAARRDVEFIIGRGDRVVLGEIGVSPRVKKVFALAEDEAHRLSHRYVGTEHLLLGLIREGEGIAADVLERQGVELYTARKEVLAALRERGGMPDDGRDV
jgi:hypothetical protein